MRNFGFLLEGEEAERLPANMNYDHKDWRYASVTRFGAGQSMGTNYY